MVTSQRRSFKGREGLAPVLVSLAVEAGELAEREVSLYSPAFKEWCPYSGGAAAATVHGLYATELRQFVAETKLLTQEAAQVCLPFSFTFASFSAHFSRLILNAFLCRSCLLQTG